MLKEGSKLPLTVKTMSQCASSSREKRAVVSRKAMSEMDVMKRPERKIMVVVTMAWKAVEVYYCVGKGREGERPMREGRRNREGCDHLMEI